MRLPRPGCAGHPTALANRDTRGAVKLVVDADPQGPGRVQAALDAAGDMVLATYAIKFGLIDDHVAETWAPYLTMAEVLRIVAGTRSPHNAERG